MHADGKAHQIGNQHDPARSVRLVGLLLPLEHEPHDQRGEHGREGVDLALDGRKPERVGKSVGQRPDGSGAEHGPNVGGRKLAAVARDEPAGEVGDGPEKEKNAEGAGDGIHGVDGHADVLGIAERKKRSQPCEHHEQRSSGRVADLELVGSGDELRAVPQARHGLHGQQVDDGRDGEDRPADEVVPTFEKIH